MNRTNSKNRRIRIIEILSKEEISNERTMRTNLKWRSAELNFLFQINLHLLFFTSILLLSSRATLESLIISSILWLGASLKEILTLDMSESNIYSLRFCFINSNVTSYRAQTGEYMNLSSFSAVPQENIYCTFSMLAILVDCFLYELYIPLFTKVLIQLLIQC